MKFSIILPVRNGGEYVKECVGSILSQTYPHFNLLILDNCSTDGTTAWVNALSDNRVQVYPSAEPLSIEQNWKRVADVPKNEFMTCIGHDDLLLPGYLQEMKRLIETYPGASLYQSQFTFIDSQGKPIRPCRPIPPALSGEELLERILTKQIDINGTGYMMRSKDYEAIGGIPAYPNLLFADFALWVDMARISGMVASAAHCFSYRLHQSMTASSADDKIQAAFGFCIDYLLRLKQQSPAARAIINTHGPAFIAEYCSSYAHRLLKKPAARRHGITVNSWVQQCRQYADKLIDNNTFDPAALPGVRMAKLVDATALGRALFLLFKKIYSKPVLR